MNNLGYQPRIDLARHYLTCLFDHGISRLVLSGQRNTDKTAFIKRDIAQALEERGAGFLYCNFGQNKDSPHQEFASALLKFMGVDIHNSNFTTSLANGTETELAHKPQSDSSDQLNNLLLTFDACLHVVDGKPCLIALDEIQHLATSREFDPFTAALRTMLDTMPANIRVLFISSSPEDLSRLLNDSDAPFYQFAMVADFPLLSSY